jgi:radical SAM protein with 4Fe4S-binding SPASM domain
MLKTICGNVRDKPLHEIWHAEAMGTMRRLTTGDRVECGGCEDKEYCFFCPALSEAESGSLAAAPPSACREAAVLRRLAAKEIGAE